MLRRPHLHLFGVYIHNNVLNMWMFYAVHVRGGHRYLHAASYGFKLCSHNHDTACSELLEWRIWSWRDCRGRIGGWQLR
jgi:hypothetical protein